MYNTQLLWSCLPQMVLSTFDNPPPLLPQSFLVMFHMHWSLHHSSSSQSASLDVPSKGMKHLNKVFFSPLMMNHLNHLTHLNLNPSKKSELPEPCFLVPIS